MWFINGVCAYVCERESWYTSCFTASAHEKQPSQLRIVEAESDRNTAEYEWLMHVAVPVDEF